MSARAATKTSLDRSAVDAPGARPRKRGLAGPPSTLSSLPHDQIAARAYLLFLSRGGEHGGDLADWYRAEAELRQARRVAEAKQPGRRRG